MQVCVPSAQRRQTIPKYQEFGTEKGLLRALQGDAGSCLKKSKLSESFQQTPFLQKGRERQICSWGQVMVRKGCSCKSLSVQSNWVTQSCLLFATPWTAARQASLSFTNYRSLLKLMSIVSVMPSNQLIHCCPLLLLPLIFPSITVFSNKSVLITWPKYWSFSFSISSSNEYSGLTSFRMDWFDLLAVQGTLKSLFQHHSSNASILQCSALFRVQLSHPYMTTGKTIALTRWTFVGQVMCLLFKMLSRLVIAFLPRSKHLLIWCLQSPSAVILEPP